MNNRDDSEDDLPPPVAFNMWGGSEVVNNSNRAVSVPEGYSTLFPQLQRNAFLPLHHHRYVQSVYSVWVECSN